MTGWSLARGMLVLSAALAVAFLVFQALTPMYAFLGSALADTMRPAHAGVWLRKPRQ